MNISLSKIKNIFLNLKNRMCGEQYRLVIWSEKLQTNQIHLEVININHNFERNNNISGIYYICNSNEDEILLYLTHLKTKYEIYELIETNFKFEDKRILTEFIIMKTDNLLFQK